MAQYGLENIKKAVNAAVEVVNVVSKIVHKQGIFSVFQLSDELVALGTIDVEAFKKEVSELSAEEKAELKQTIKDKLSLVDKEVEAKIESGLDLVEKGTALVEKVVGILKEAKELVEEAKALYAPETPKV